MVWPVRPRFVLFGSSIVQLSYILDGWGALLTSLYSRQADIILRGYSGWNSRQAVEVLDQVFPKGEAVQPAMVFVYFGGNDSVKPRPNGSGSHVPLSEFVENMRKIAIHLRSLSDDTVVIFATPPPGNEAQMLEVLGEDGRTNELLQQYGEALLKLCNEMGIRSIDLFSAFKQQENWEATSFTDGIHLSAAGSRIVIKEVIKVLREYDQLHWGSLPVEFA